MDVEVGDLVFGSAPWGQFFLWKIGLVGAFPAEEM